MAQKVTGNISGLTSSEIRIVEKLYSRRIDKEEIVTPDLAKELYTIALKLNRRVGLLVSREGHIEEVFLGRKDILYLPDLGRYRLGSGRLRRLRLIYSDLSKDPNKAQIPQDIYTDLEKLRLDLVMSIKLLGGRIIASYAHMKLNNNIAEPHTVSVPDLAAADINFAEMIEQVEYDLSQKKVVRRNPGHVRALLVGVYDSSTITTEHSLDELRELARTAGVEIAGTVIQRRKPDPRTILGAGKLEEVVLTALRLEAEMIIFDTELKPTQWRSVTKATDMKVIDRSMLILDIFAQRASSADGRLQVELAQLKYNLPRLTEMDSGLSRLSGGIGGRGPGETKLEVSRRVVRDRIADLEKRIRALGGQRTLRKKRRVESEIPLVAIVGYTNVGKSTLFNLLTKSSVIAENKLFATLDPAKRRVVVPIGDSETGESVEFILSDTVGFIRDLPMELMNAFRATLEEIADAALLVHVLDSSDPEIDQRKEAVESILTEVGAGSIPRLNTINKMDRAEAGVGERIAREYDGIAISAAQKINTPELMQRLAKFLLAKRNQIEVETIPVEQSQE